MFFLFFLIFQYHFVVSHFFNSWEADFMVLFSRLAENNIGYIDWKPLIPLIFSKILNNFGLPVGFR